CHLRLRQLSRVQFVGERKNAAGYRRLNYVCPVLHFETDGFANRLRAIGNSIGEIGLWSEKTITIATTLIEMPPGCPDPIRCDKHARTNYHSFGDCITQGH